MNRDNLQRGRDNNDSELELGDDEEDDYERSRLKYMKSYASLFVDRNTM